MSGKGCFMSRVIHVQSELAACICVIAVAFTHSLQLPRCLNHAGSLSRFRACYCLCFRVFLCEYVNISAPWICLPYGWVNQDPSPLCFNMQSYCMWFNHFSLSGFWILRYAFSLNYSCRIGESEGGTVFTRSFLNGCNNYIFMTIIKVICFHKACQLRENETVFLSSLFHWGRLVYSVIEIYEIHYSELVLSPY